MSNKLFVLVSFPEFYMIHIRILYEGNDGVSINFANIPINHVNSYGKYRNNTTFVY